MVALFRSFFATLAALGEGYLPYHVFGSRFRRENSIMAAKFKKQGEIFKKIGAEIQKSQKNFLHYVAKTFFSCEGPFYPVLVRSGHEGGG